jgi:hypothetical protein
MGKLPQRAIDQTTTLRSVADMESRRQKDQRPLVPVNADNATLTSQSMPHTPAEVTSLQTPAPPKVAVVAGQSGVDAERAKEPTQGGLPKE